MDRRNFLKILSQAAAAGTAVPSFAWALCPPQNFAVQGGKVVSDSPGCSLPAEGRKSDPVGTRYASQKIVYTDAVTGNTVWRMTKDALGGAMNSIDDASGHETSTWSPDATKLCYGKTGHPAKPDGIYMMELATGVETFLAPSFYVTKYLNRCFSKTSQEVFYLKEMSAPPVNGVSKSKMQLRAVNYLTFVDRLLKEMPDVNGINAGVMVNSDGSYLWCYTSYPPNGDFSQRGSGNRSQIMMIISPQGVEHPNWKFDVTTPDRLGAGSHPYWNPANPKVLACHRNGSFGLRNIDTLVAANSPQVISETGSMPIGHRTWTADGNTILGLSGNPHPDADPTQIGAGGTQRYAYDGNAGGGGPYIFISPQTRMNPPTFQAGDRICAHYNYSSTTRNEGHCHTEYSRDGKFLVFRSDVSNTSVAPPPGYSNAQWFSASNLTTDLFVVPL